MRKIIRYLWISLLLFGVLTGCGQVVENDTNIVEHMEEETKEKNYVTKEFLIEVCGFTEEDLEHIDIETMAEELNLVQNVSTKMIRKLVLGCKDRYLMEGYGFDYRYWREKAVADEELKKEEIGNIKVIAFEDQDGNYYESVLYDFDKKVAYLGELVSLTGRGVTPTKEKSLSDMDIENVRELFISCNVPGWKKYYDGNNENTTGSGWWNLYVELEDGRILHYGGFGARNGVPINFGEFSTELSEFFKDYVTKEFLIENCGFTAEELEGVDIDTLAQEHYLLIEKEPDLIRRRVLVHMSDYVIEE